PRRSLAIRDHLHLDVSCPGHQPLQEDNATAEGTLGFGSGAFVGLSELGVRIHYPDAPATTAGGRLEHEWITDLRGRMLGPSEVGDGAPTPRRYRYPYLLGQQFRADLVTEPTHRLGARADEVDAQLFAQLHESGVLGDESPADPGGVGTGVDERLLQHREVQIRPVGSLAETVRVVGLPNECRSTVDVGV